MRELAAQLTAWDAAGERYAVASVIGVLGSTPRQAGAALAVSAAGVTVGSVSGGCVEGAVYELAQQAIAEGRPTRTSFTTSGDEPFAIGLTCGGELDVFVQPVAAGGDPAVSAALGAAAAGAPAALARIVAGPQTLVGRAIAVTAAAVTGSTGDPELDRSVIAETRSMLERGQTGSRWLGRHGDCGERELEVFIESWAAPPRMLVFGAIDYAAAVASVGTFLGYRVTVCDARPVFATPERFPAADEVVVDWPHRYLAGTETDHRTVVCVLTHDPKFDIPLLAEALRRPVAYVGALGSRSTHADRLRALREAGVSEAELSRLRAPIGLDLGARTPEETAVSIAAEIIANRYGGSGRPLSTSEGPIHALALPHG